MNRTHLHVKRNRASIEVVSGVILLLSGCVIYVLFRSKSLNIYQWCCALGLTGLIDNYRGVVHDWNVSDVVKYSLPDGIYCAAYILIVDAIWHREYGIQKYIVISLVPIVAIGCEVLQGLNLIRGTFDVLDLVCYALPPLVYVCIIKYKNNNKKQQV